MTLGLTGRDTVLILGGDSAELARLLAPWVREVHGAVSEASRDSDSASADRLSPSVVDRALSQLVLPARSIDWIILNGPLASDRDLEPIVAALLPIVRPGGRVVMNFSNRRSLGGRLGAHRSGAPDGLPCRGINHALQLTAAAGCSDLTCFAVLPDARAPRTVIPLEPPCPPAAETFALNQTWKRATAGRALARWGLRVLIHLHVMRHLYPNYVVVGRIAC